LSILRRLTTDNIYRPDWISLRLTESNKVHVTSNVLGCLAFFPFGLGTPRIFRPNVSLRLKFTRDSHVPSFARNHDSFDRHRQLVSGQHFAMLGNSYKVHPAAILLPNLFD